MTVSTTANRWTYAGNGVTTAFAYTNIVWAAADLLVYVDGALKTLTTDYSVSGVGAGAGGNVTFVAAPASGADVVIVADVGRLQAADLIEGDPMPAEDWESRLDRVTRMVQRAHDLAARAFRLADGDPTAAIVLPDADERAGNYLTFDASGNPAVTAAVDLGATSVSAFIATLLDDADAATARGTLGAVAKAGDTLSGALDLADNLLTAPKLKDVALNGQADATFTGAESLNYASGPEFFLTVTGNVTGVTWSNWPAAGQGARAILHLKEGSGGPYTWDLSVDAWVGGSAPSPGAVGSTDTVIVFADPAGRKIAQHAGNWV